MAITAQKISSNGLYQVNGNFDEVTFNPNSTVASTNNVYYSQDFENAVWTKSNSSVVANVAKAPDGSVTADAFYESTDVANAYHSVFETLSASISSGTYTLSAYVQIAGANTTYNGVEISLSSHGGTNFNLNTGGKNFDFGPCVGSIVNVGSGWYRVATVITVTTPGTYIVNILSSTAVGATSYQGSGQLRLNIWGAQFEANNTASIYVPMGNGVITPAAKAKTVSPGIVYTSGALDEVTYNTQSGVVKNLLAYSQQIGNGSFWTVSSPTASVGSTTITAPDGTPTATQIIEDNILSQYKGTSFSSVNSVPFNATVNNSLTYTISAYAKSISNRNFEIVCKETGTFSRQSYVGFSLTTGTVMYTSTFNGITVNSTNIVPVGNGWNRCMVTYTLGGTATGQYFQFNLLNGITSSANTYTGDGASSIYLWGAQVERGSTATIYVPTGANAVPAPAFVSRADSSGNLYSPKYFDEVTGMINTNGLVASWDVSKSASFPSTGNILTDISGNVNDLTLNGIYTYNAGTSFNMAGTGNAIRSSNTINGIASTTTSFSVAIWFKYTTTATYTASFEKQNTTGSSVARMDIGYIGGGANLMYWTTWYQPTATINDLTYSTIVNAGTWYYTVLTANSTTGKISYLNGQQVASSAAIANWPDATQTLGIGGNIRKINGEIGEIQIYNRPLSAIEVADNFNATRTRYGV